MRIPGLNLESVLAAWVQVRHIISCEQDVVLQNDKVAACIVVRQALVNNSAASIGNNFVPNESEASCDALRVIFSQV